MPETRAFVFPGQGSQYAGMGKDLSEGFSVAREVFEAADDALGFHLSRLCFEGPESELLLTENTQPAILTVSVAAWKVLGIAGATPEWVAGHSLGEYSALVAAGALSFEDAVMVVRQRGRFMQEAVPVGEGAMAAILGLGKEVLMEICQQGSQGEVVSPANINAPDQIVIAGKASAVERVCDLARGAGAKRVIPLSVSAPFHCALMLPAQNRLAEVLEETSFRDLMVPLVNNVDAIPVRSAAEARDGLVRQVSCAVRWTDCVERMIGEGVRSFVEVGPGKVLAGLIRKIDRSVETMSVGTSEQVKTYV